MLNKQDIEALKKARLAVKAGWCKKSYGRNSSCSHLDNDRLELADEVCIMGGLYLSGVHLDLGRENRIAGEISISIEQLYPELGVTGPTHFNDHDSVTQSDVVRVLEHTISRTSRELGILIQLKGD